MKIAAQLSTIGAQMIHINLTFEFEIGLKCIAASRLKYSAHKAIYDASLILYISPLRFEVLVLFILRKFGHTSGCN